MPKALSKQRARKRIANGEPLLSRKWGEPTDRRYFNLGLSMFHLSEMLAETVHKLALAYETNDLHAMQAPFTDIVGIMHTVIQDGTKLGLDESGRWFDGWYYDEGGVAGSPDSNVGEVAPTMGEVIPFRPQGLAQSTIVPATNP